MSVPVKNDDPHHIAKFQQEDLISTSCKKIYGADPNKRFNTFGEALDQLLPYHLFLDVDPEEADVSETPDYKGKNLVMSRQHVWRDTVLLQACNHVKKVEPIALAIAQRLEEMQVKKRKRTYENFTIEKWMRDAQQAAMAPKPDPNAAANAQHARDAAVHTQLAQQYAARAASLQAANLHAAQSRYAAHAAVAPQQQQQHAMLAANAAYAQHMQQQQLLQPAHLAAMQQARQPHHGGFSAADTAAALHFSHQQRTAHVAAAIYEPPAPVITPADFFSPLPTQQPSASSKQPATADAEKQQKLAQAAALAAERLTQEMNATNAAQVLKPLAAAQPRPKLDDVPRKTVDI